MAVGSTVLNSLGLERYGLHWRWPEIDCAHPLDNGDGGVLQRSLNDTAAGLASDGPRWRSIFGKPSATFDVLPASTYARVFCRERCSLRRSSSVDPENHVHAVTSVVCRLIL